MRPSWPPPRTPMILPGPLVEKLEEKINVFPSSKVLKKTQNRLIEKKSLQQIGVQTTEFWEINTVEDLKTAAEKVGFPAFLKTTFGGYDGKGQRFIDSEVSAQEAFSELYQGEPLILEKKVDFKKEISVIAVRNTQGEVVTFPVGENVHVENILDTTLVPTDISQDSENLAREIATKIAEKFDIVGTFGTEMFLLPNGDILVNEIAPRPHNSGHYTIDACATSQFEQQCRAVCGLPLGSTELIKPVVMKNILGDGNGNTLSGTEKLLTDQNVKLHLYGKAQSKAKRKMGHFTVMGENPQELIAKAAELHGCLFWQ